MMKARLVFLAMAFAAVASCTPQASAPEGSGIAWESELEAARKLAVENGPGRLILVGFMTDWCGWCRKLEKDVLAKEPFQAKAREKLVLVKINPDQSAANRQLAGKYNVQGFPTLVFLRPDGEPVRKIAGYVPLDEFLLEIDAALESGAKTPTDVPSEAGEIG